MVYIYVAKCELDLIYILESLSMPLQTGPNFEELQVHILDYKNYHLWNKIVVLVKLAWQDHLNQEVTWEHEENIQVRFLHLYAFS